MRKHRKLLIIGLALVIGAAVAYQQLARVPQTILLLPDGDLLLYVNFKPLHLLNLSKSSVQSDFEYKEFVRQTGIEWGSDLDNAAVSQRNPGSESESSAIFTGHFDSTRLKDYLQKLSSGTERYADQTIYLIPHEGRTVRACILKKNMVGITNMASSEPMRGVIDKSRDSSLIGRGPDLLESHYRQVPLISLAWAIYRVPSQPGAAQLPLGMSFDFLENTVTVASVRPEILEFLFHRQGSLYFKARVLAENDAAAQDLAERASSFLALYRTVSKSVGAKGADRDVKAIIDSIQIQQNGNSAVVTATIPEGFLKKATSENGAISVGK